jgi:hypothetical protein
MRVATRRRFIQAASRGLVVIDDPGRTTLPLFRALSRAALRDGDDFTT